MCTDTLHEKLIFRFNEVVSGEQLCKLWDEFPTFQRLSLSPSSRTQLFIVYICCTPNPKADSTR